MFLDLDKADGNPFAVDYDVCVAGSGPAGMTVARELASRGARVLLLEGGGLEPSARSQELCEARSIGPLQHWGVSTCRLRFLGGASGHWSGRCATLESIDFEARDIWSVPGWPISHAETYRRLDEARDILDIADQSLAPRSEPHWRKSRLVPAGYARSAPTRFGEKYRDDLKDSRKITVALNANVVGAEFDEARSRILSLTVRNYRDGAFKAKARAFVIAFGALENARFMLNVAEQAHFPFGNEGDFVGRCFMEHFNIVLGRFISFRTPLWAREDSLSLITSGALAQDRRIGTATVSLTPNGKPRHYGRLAFLRKARNDLECALLESNAGKNADRNLVCNGDGVVGCIVEQTPNPSSRVTLDAGARDRFGAARLALDWRMTDQDNHTISELARETGIALAAQDAGRLQIALDIRKGEPEVGFHCHQMGTTRMAASPRAGVVDSDCRIFGMENAYIAGSSVFSTGGGVNPTLTIVSLALRLGEHLAGKFVAG